MAQNQDLLRTSLEFLMMKLLLIIKEIGQKITFGAKITGAGDGGCIIALTQNR